MRHAIATGLVLALAGFPAVFPVGSGNDLLPDIPAGDVGIRLEVVGSISPNVLIDIAHAGDGSGRLFLVSPDGVVRILDGGTVLPVPFLSDPATPPDRAMSSLAFHPDFTTNGKLYVITGEETSGAADYDPPQDDKASAFDNVIYEYVVDATDPNLVDPTSKRELLRVHQPDRLHNLNDLTFGHDGYLYIASGDGGDTRTGTPTQHNTTAQQTTNPYGAILRIDVDARPGGAPYGIPPDNPFADGAGGNVPEIYAWGLRNPWRISTDRLTGAIWTGVNGDITIEQIYRVESGRNFGWDVREGSFLWDSVTGAASVDPMPDPQFTAPDAEYDHNHTTTAFGSQIGGYVYRGAAMPELWGRYISFDWRAAMLIGMETDTGALEILPIDPAGAPMIGSLHITMGEDEDGELYVGGGDGSLLRLTQAPTADDAGRIAPETPLTVSRGAGATIDLDWGTSCNGSDDDYAVYAGTIGDFDGHLPVLCSTSGSTSTTVAPAVDDEYYLVVPHNGTNEGSYGKRGDGGPRPASAGACLPRRMGSCPP